MKYSLVQTNTSDKLILSGLLCESGDKNVAVIHVHGYEGDFYTNLFIHEIAQKLYTQNISFLSIQHRGTGCETELYKFPYGSGGMKYGAHYEKLEEAHIDISAWIEYLKSLGYKKFILQGHSLGTIKVMRYMYEGEYKNEILKLILLAPFDKNYEIRSEFEMSDFYKEGAKLENMLEMVKLEIQKGNGRKLAPIIINNDLRTYDNLLSWATFDDLGRMFDFSLFDKYDFPILKGIKIPVCIIVGTEDPFFHPSNPKNPSEVLEKIKEINSLFETNLLEGADHGFEGEEKVVSNIISNYLKD